MKQRFLPLRILLLAGLFAACNGNGSIADATGTFEVDEVIVSSELTGKLLSFDIQEGDSIPKDKIVGVVDAVNLSLQKEQVQASIEALNQKTADLTPQVKLLEDQLKVQESQMKNLLHEKARLDNLIKADAATAKQMDDMNAQIDVVTKQMQVTRQQIQVARSNVSTQNRGILSEGKPLEKRVAQIDDQLKRASILNPVAGTVIEKYAEAGEMTATGKALYKIADLSEMTLRAYVTGTQLPEIKLGQSVTVLIDNGEKGYKDLTGTITWISDKAEFTPKTIQTREERANLVYAIKVKVKNSGNLKIGMYGEIKFL